MKTSLMETPIVESSILSNMTKESGNEENPRTPKVYEDHITEEFEGQAKNNQESFQTPVHSIEQNEKNPEDYPESLRLQPGRRSMQCINFSQNRRSCCLTSPFQLNETGKKSGQSEAVIVWSPQFQISECENDSNFGLMLPIVPRTNRSETYSTVPRHRASRSLESNIRIILTPERRRPIPLQLPLDRPISKRCSFQNKETDQDNQDLSIVSSCLLDKAFIEDDEANVNSVEKTIQTLCQICEDMPKLEQEISANVVPRGLKLGKSKKLKNRELFGIQWTLWREHKFPGGGILLNKNLNTAAVVAACAYKSKEIPESVHNPQESHPDTDIISRSTLLICCNKSLNKLETGIRSVTRGRISLYVHKGARRTINAQKLGSHQIVLTTYSVLLAEFNAKCLHPSPLKQVYWERIVLDEGDIMRNTKAVTTQVITDNIRGRHCWVVLKNWPREYAPQNFKCIIKFLKLAPFDDDEVWDSVFGKKTKESKEYWEAIRKSLVSPHIL